MRETTKGLWAMIGAASIWGLSPIYYKALAFVPPLEVLSHRTIWSLVIFGAVLIAQGRLGELRRALGARRSVVVVALAALTISVNWGVFIWSIQTGHGVEASLGYYIFPLVSVLLGAAVLGERLRAIQIGAVVVVGLAVVILALGLGAPPWISLILAGTFGAYGLIKKRLALGPVVSVTGEVTLLAPLALVWLFGVHGLGWEGVTGRNLGAFGHDLGDSLLLMLAGVLTAMPLMLFTTASRSLPFGTVGVMQYINPTIQFAVAALVFAEPVTRWHWIAFPLIWIAVALYSAETLRQDRASRRLSVRVSTSGTTET